MFFIPAIMAGCMALFAATVPPSDGAPKQPAVAAAPAAPRPQQMATPAPVKAAAPVKTAAAPPPAKTAATPPTVKTAATPPTAKAAPCLQAAAPRRGFTPDSLMAALRHAGYAATAMDLPKDAPSVSGAIATRIDKADVVILLDQCGKSGTGRACTVFLSTTFIDDRGLVDARLITRMNGHMVFGKATLKPGDGGHAAFMLSYAVSADVAADPGAIVAALRNFRTDITRAFRVYRAAAGGKTH